MHRLSGRWELWKKDYDFAAVPPTPEGEQMARKILDDAWPKYPGVLDRIRGGAASITPDPHATPKCQMRSHIRSPDKH